MNTKKLIASSIATVSLLGNAILPVFATETIVISGNGSGSTNFATVNQTTTTTVTQSNNAYVTNNVDADADTGDNSAQFNTGGAVAIATGNANVDVTVSNDLNKNLASVDACCDEGDTLVKIDGNGAYSLNTVTLGLTNATVVDQDNVANVYNNVNSDADTGDNNASLNTGGDVTVVTGKAMVDVDLSTVANVNVAHVGGSAGAGNPTAAFVITGNGAGSGNYITAGLTKAVVLDQDNNAKVTNKVDADADTGDNDAKFNTGGDVIIHTGNADVTVDIDNAVNFNSASLDCPCTWDLLAKIEGNGASPYYYGGGEWSYPWIYPNYYGDNVITLGLTNTQVVGQDNLASLKNDAKYLDADTGYNTNSLNTGEAGTDPLVVTGNASTGVDINNTGNMNTLGSFLPVVWPDFGDLELSFDWSALVAFFGMSHHA